MAIQPVNHQLKLTYEQGGKQIYEGREEAQEEIKIWQQNRIIVYQQNRQSSEVDCV